jgi:hypothetical protein
LQFAGKREEDAVGPDGGLASCRIGVECDEDSGAGQVSGPAEYRGLLAGQGGAAWGETCVTARVGDGDRDGVERPFHDDGGSAARKVVARLVQAE